MGQFFGLLHNFEGIQNANETSQCLTRGDKACDTAPDISGSSFTMSDCTMFGNYFDQKEESFKPDLFNYMSYYYQCRNSFSPEQQKNVLHIKNIKLLQFTTKA
jgi:hypothetical protein